MQKLMFAAFAALMLAACGETTQGQPPLIIVNLPDLPTVTNVTVVTATPTDPNPLPTTPCSGACGERTRCDEAMNACVAVATPATPNPLLERCPQFDYTATKFPRPADQPIEVTRGDRGLLFGVVLEGCNAEQIERLAIRAPGFEGFSVIQLMNDGRRRDAGTSEATNMAGVALIAIDDVRVGIGEKISLLIYGAPNATTSTGPTNVELYAVHARRIEDDGIARLSSAHIGEVIQVVEGQVSCLPNSAIHLEAVGGARDAAPPDMTATVGFRLMGGASDIIVRDIGIEVSGVNNPHIECLSLSDMSGGMLDIDCGFILAVGTLNHLFRIGSSGQLRIPSRANVIFLIGVRMRPNALIGETTTVRVVGMNVLNPADQCDPGWTAGRSDVSFTTR